MHSEYLTSVTKQFKYCKSLGDKTLSQLEESNMLWKFNEESNSIAIIVNHLYGNMKSRWTEFLTSDGEKEWRNRDNEFENQMKSKKELLIKWNDGWQYLFQALNSINTENFNTEIYIRNQSHSIVEAINRQLSHYSYHVGQIVFIGKMIKTTDWQSLSIPKGQSSGFNNAKFSKGKHGGHFTDDIK